MTVAQDFVTWAWDLDVETIPDTVLDAAGLHLLDGLGAALAGRRSGVTDFAVAVGQAGGGPAEATILGDRDRVAAPWAAFTNGVLMHALDYDDTHTGGLVHATAVTLPTALAVGEQYRRSGAEVLVAAVTGYELVARLSLAAPHGFHTRGFHATSVCGTFTSALIAARLGGADRSAAVAALGIAGSQAAGSMEFLSTGSSTKQLHPGWASMAGIVAARLGAAGASGPASVIEGDYGLYRLFTDLEVNPAAILDGLGTTWETERISIKPYPACHLIHSTLDAAGTLGRLNGSEIAEVEVTLPADSVPIVAEPSAAKIVPRSPYEAKFSAQWSVAAMLLDGAVNVATYHPSWLARPELLDLSARVRYEVSGFDGPVADAPGEVRVVLADGTRVIGRAGGGPRDSSSIRGSVLDKFHVNAGGDPEVRARLAGKVLELPSCGTVEDVLRLANQLGSDTAVVNR